MKVGPPVPYSGLTVGVLKETYPGENRVSLAPSNVRTLVDAGLKVVVESGGECVFFYFFNLGRAKNEANRENRDACARLVVLEWDSV
jgi:hypothetical protein